MNFFHNYVVSSIDFLYNYFTSTNNIYTISYWIWIFSFLFVTNISEYSLLYLSFIFFCLGVIYQIFVKKELYYYKIFTIGFELFIFLLNYYKHYHYYKLKTFSKKDIIFNIALFVTYNIFLYINDLNMYSFYINNNAQIKNLK